MLDEAEIVKWGLSREKWTVKRSFKGINVWISLLGYWRFYKYLNALTRIRKKGNLIDIKLEWSEKGMV